MLAPLHDVLDLARRSRRAVGAFTCYDLEMALAVSGAAEELASPAILVVSAEAFRAERGEALLACVLQVASGSSAPICVQLDHVDDPEIIERAFSIGAGSAMADGSRLPLDDNLRLVRRAVTTARRFGSEIEAELGRIEGDEERAGVSTGGALTDPELVPVMVDAGIACLAVSIGNAHGRYAGPVTLDWERLDAIRVATPIHLSLHGASGLSDSTLRRAVSAGITKVNVNTELRETYLASLSRWLPVVLEGSRVLELKLAITEELRRLAVRRMRTLGA